jgi:hypothetical protein
VIQAAESSLPPVLPAVYDHAQVKEALPFTCSRRSVLEGDMGPDWAASQIDEEVTHALETV